MGKYVAIPYYGTFRCGYKQFVGPVKKTYLTDKEIVNLLYRYDPTGAKIPLYAIDPYNESVKVKITSEKDLLIPEDEFFHRVKNNDPVVEEKPEVVEAPKTEIDEVIEEVAVADEILTPPVEENPEVPVVETVDATEVADPVEHVAESVDDAAIEEAVNEARTETVEVRTATPNYNKNQYKKKRH